MKSIWDEDRVTIFLSGRIDSNNAMETEKEIDAILSEKKASSVVMDAEDLQYISSAGLRCLLHVRKLYADMSVINVSPEVYEIFDMTGFTEMMNISKAYRQVSIEGCEVIGQGANGTIYRIDQDNVVKVYNNADALEDIQHEREVARLALILGIPTAISYDVVKVGNSYGSVFELLNAQSFSKILETDPDKFEWCVSEYVEMLKKIHSTVVPAGKLPDMREVAISWGEFVKDYLPEEEGKKLVSLIEALPHDDHMIHGDYHTKNLELQNDEVLLIDMDTLAVGHPVLEFASIYNAFKGFHELNHDGVKDFLGFDYDVAQRFMHRVFEEYLGTKDESIINSVVDKSRIIGYTRLIRRSIRRNGLESEQGRADIENWKKELISLLNKTDTLTFDVGTADGSSENQLDIEASNDKLQDVLSFVDEKLEAAGCSMKAQMQIDIAVEEIFVNIANYAYNPEKGMATVRVKVNDDPLQVMITFVDHGTPYDPLAKEDPDITLSAEERPIGGLGIFMVKQSMDDVQYEYKDGSNILTLVKSL